MSAGYTPGVPRLGIPAIQSSDASMGVTNPGYRPDDEGATAFPASVVIGSSFNPQLAREGGAAIAREARLRGFNVQLAGGINLARDPRNGRNFEYYSEDPYLSAVLGAEAVNGIQGEGVISTLKHYTLNCNETNRHWLDAIIEPDAHRESDLLAFQIAIERSQPGSIMTSYNKINGEYSSGNSHLLNDVLKGACGYKGWVMSDWGAVPSDLQVSGGETITATFTVTNTGKREGADVPQLYLTQAAGDKRMRLLGFERIELKPGEARRVTLTTDPRLLARFDGTAGRWSIADGTHRVAVGKSATGSGAHRRYTAVGAAIWNVTIRGMFVRGLVV